MTDHLPWPLVINSMLISHLLFINSLPTITAWDQMKGEGKLLTDCGEEETEKLEVRGR